MGYTIPSDQVAQAISIVAFSVDSRLKITRLFQRLMGELGMGRFITHSGRVPTTHKIFDDWLETIIDAYIVYLGLPLILCFAADWIAGHKNLREFFTKWPVAIYHINMMEDVHWKTPPDTTWTHYRDLVLDLMGFSKIINSHFNPMEDLRSCERYKHCRAIELQEEGGLGDLQLVQNVAQRLEPTTYMDALFITHYDKIRSANPFIALELAVLFSYIELLKTYRKIALKQLYETEIPPWLKYQSTRIYAEEDLIERQYFNHQGKVRLTLPITPDSPGYLKFNTYGLETILTLPFAEWQRLILERWHEGACPVPVFELLVLEEWTSGQLPILGWELAVLEDWTPAPWEVPEEIFDTIPFVKMVFEEWTS
jgi:hypothetical protein